MNKEKIGLQIDNDLIEIGLNETMKMYIRNSMPKHKRKSPLKVITACVASLALCATTVFAGYIINSRINVNATTLPQLDSMYVVSTNEAVGRADEYGIIRNEYNSYDTLVKSLGVPLLDSDLAIDHPYMVVHERTNNKDYNMVTVDNYLIGDTSNFRFLPEINRYRYNHGTEYYSTVSLAVDIILSNEQMETGLEIDYLGMYKFQESYISEQGYTVNIVRSTDRGEAKAESLSEEVKVEKCAIFVADGIRYTLKGRVSTDTLKYIVNSMKPSLHKGDAGK